MNLRDILRQAGFSGTALNTAYAIAMAESGGNARAFNGNRKTGDKSFGLFQINMLGGMGPERRRQYGLASDDSLYDAMTNAKVAYKMSKGGSDWSPWSTYNNNAYKKYLSGGNTAVTAGVIGGAAVGQSPAAQALEPDQQAPVDIISSAISDSFAPGQSGFVNRRTDFSAKQVNQQVASTPTTGGSWAGGGSGSSSLRDKVIAAAMGVLGTPYSWGGGTTKGASEGFGKGAGIVGFDCSSLVQYAFAQAGYSMPRTGRPQLALGQRTSISNLRPGDLVGWGDGYHIAIYIGDGKIIQSPTTGKTVQVSTLGRNTKAWGVRLNLPGD